MITNLRLRNTYNEDGGAWINANTGQLAYARKLLADLRVEEPEAGWRLETRGTATQWHRMRNEDQPTTPEKESIVAGLEARS